MRQVSWRLEEFKLGLAGRREMAGSMSGYWFEKDMTRAQAKGSGSRRGEASASCLGEVSCEGW